MNIHVGNLPKTAKKDALVKLFEPYGKVASATIARDKKSGSSRGFGYVEMVKPDEAEKAILELNDKEFAGQKLTVGEAQERKEQSGRGGAGKGRDRFDQQRGGGLQARAGASNNSGMGRRGGRRGA